MATPKDLHIAKDSHLSIPVKADMEFHLRKTDVEMDPSPQVGDHVFVLVPSVITSSDKDDVRAKQEGTVRIVPNTHMPDPEELLEGLDQ